MQPVSTVFDNHGNRIDRYEIANEPGQVPAVTLAVTLSERTDRNAEQVKAWYWREVGVIHTTPVAADGKPLDEWEPEPEPSAYKPEAAVLYDGTPGSGTL